MDPEAPKRMSPIQTFNQSNVYPSYKMESHQENLLYHIEVCWLSHGKALKKHHKWVMHIYFTKTSGPNLLPFSVMKSHCQQYAAKQILKKTPTNPNEPNSTTFKLSLQDKVVLSTENCFLKQICGMETTFWKWSISTIMWFYCQNLPKCVNYKKPFISCTLKKLGKWFL